MGFSVLRNKGWTVELYHIIPNVSISSYKTVAVVIIVYQVIPLFM